MVSVVNTPNKHGIPVSDEACATPFDTSDATKSKWVVEPLITAPNVMIESYFPDEANFL